MRQAEIEPKKSHNIGIWRILFGILVVIVVAIAAIATNLPGVQQLMNDPGRMFAGDDVLEEAARELQRANTRIASRPDDESAHLDRANSYIAFGYLEGASLEFEQWQSGGGSEWGDVGRAIDELKLKTDEIRALLHDAEQSDSPSTKYPPIYTLLNDIADRFAGLPKYRALFLKGYLLLREGRKAEAEPIFAEGLDHYVALQDYVMYNHGRSISVTGNEEAALEKFDEFLETYPSSRIAPLAHLERINILRDLGRLEDAIQECQRALDRYPTSAFAPKTLRKWAEIYESEMDFNNGADIRARIVREYPDSWEAANTVEMFFGGVYALQLLDESEQVDIAFAAVEDNTSEASTFLELLSESSNLSPEEKSKACHGVARCEYIFGRYYDCIDWARRARNLAPGSEWADRAGIRIGHAYWRLDKISLAKEAYLEVVEGHGPVAPAAGDILWRKAYNDSDIDLTGDVCRYIVDEYPDSDETPAALTMLAYLGCRDGHYQSGRGFAENCVSAFPNNPSSAEAGFWLARALQGLGRNTDAREAYEELARRVPWNFWGIRAGEISDTYGEDYEALDPFGFDPSKAGNYDGSLAVALELYDAGVLDLAGSEFRLAVENGERGAQVGLALVTVEQGLLQSGVRELRKAVATGDQAYVTPAIQGRILDELYPRPFVDLIREAALAHEVHASWIWGPMRQESCFNPRARSSSDARGLIQIMPETGRFIAAQRGWETFDPELLWDPELNIDFGTWYVSYLKGIVGGNRLLDVLAAYNGGPGRLTRWRDQLPTRDDDIFISAIPVDETRNFAHWVYTNVRMYDVILEREGFELVPF